MYVITYHNPNNNEDQIILGPIDWQPDFISSCIQDDLQLDSRPQVLKSDVLKVPFEIIPNVMARRAVIEGIEYNQKTQFLVGPYWSYVDGMAVGNYKVADKNVDIVKSELKSVARNQRYAKEVSGFQFNINESSKVFITTDREGRRTFFEKLAVIGEGTVSYKFNEVFYELNRELLQQICNSIDNHVQSAFDWENNMYTAIDSCQTLKELDDLVI